MWLARVLHCHYCKNNKCYHLHKERAAHQLHPELFTCSPFPLGTTLLSSISHLFPSNILSTSSLACWNGINTLFTYYHELWLNSPLKWLFLHLWYQQSESFKAITLKPLQAKSLHKFLNYLGKKTHNKDIPCQVLFSHYIRLSGF